MSDEVIAETFANRFRILETIGRGGLGTVYKALDTHFQRLVALKVLRFSPDAESRQRFLKEADVLARLNHPNIVRVYDAGEAGGLPYLALEYVEGQNLQQIVKEDRRLDAAKAVYIVLQVGKALEYAHSRGVVHRDVKPSNILISTQGQVFLTDFGLAIAPGSATLTGAGTIAGTVGYMSPEQAMGKPLDARSDIFSLGVVLYELWTGRPPFSGVTLVDVLRQIIEQEPPRPRELNPSVPVAPSVEEALRRSLAKQPEQRFLTAEQLVTALAESVDEASGADFEVSGMNGLHGLGTDPFRKLESDKEPQATQGTLPGSEGLGSGERAPVHIKLGKVRTPEPRTSAAQAAERHGVSAARATPRSRLIWLAAALGALLLIMVFPTIRSRHFVRLAPPPAPSTSVAAAPVRAVNQGSLRERGAIWFHEHGLSVLLAASLTLVLWFLLRFLKQTRRRATRHRSVPSSVPEPGPRLISPKPWPAPQAGAESAKASESGQATSEPKAGAISESPESTTKLYGTKLYPVDTIQDALTDDEVIPYTPSGVDTKVPTPSPSVSAKLLVLNGPMRGRQFRLKPDFIIGRGSDCDLSVGSQEGPAPHLAKITLEDDRFYIRRLNSSSLVAVNGMGAQKQELRDHDEIQIDRAIILFVQTLGMSDLNVEAKRRLLEFDSTWDELTESVRDG